MDRQSSFGQGGGLTIVDRFGIWLSLRAVRRQVGIVADRDICDIGSGYSARIGRGLAELGARVTVVDLALDPALAGLPGMRLVEDRLPGVLPSFPDEAFDVVLCVSVLEHLSEPETALAEFHRMLRPGGLCFVNVPSWRGKFFLELSAFRLGLSPALEMDDHKMYYDPKDLWPLLVRAGFRPSSIRCRRHKFSLNTFAVCRKAKEKTGRE